MNEFIIKGHTVAGTRTITANLENQDFILTKEDDKRIISCVADGATGAGEAAREAAKINTEVALKISKMPTIWQMGDKKFKSIVAEKYEDAFYDSNTPLESLAATTAFVIIDKRTNKYIAFGCGDSAVLSFDSSFNTRPLITPMNIGKKSSTIFTNSSSLLKKYSSFVTGTLDNIKGFVIYTDGAETMTSHPNGDFKNFLASAYVSDDAFEKEQEYIFEGLQSITRDDISINIVGIVDNEIKTNAYNIYYNIKNIEHEVSDDFESVRTDPVPEKKLTAYSASPDILSNSQLLQFLKKPAEIDEIVSSGVIDQEDIIEALTVLIRLGVVTCVGNSFKAV